MPIATFSLVALDCPDPDELAAFYAAITGWRIRVPPALDVEVEGRRWVEFRVFLDPAGHPFCLVRALG